MDRFASLEELPRGLRFVATLGIFDGVHRGHAEVLAATVRAGREAGGATAVAITFRPHPEAVLRGGAPPLLCDPIEREARIAAAGLAIVVQPFDLAFSRQSAREFVERLGRGRHLEGLVMSAESAFGHDRMGTVAALRSLAMEAGFRLVELPSLELGGTRVSSTRIRTLVEAGRLSAAGRLLGRRYAVIGEIVHGDRRGRELGYPTANFGFDEPVVLPPNGVYAVRISWGGADPLHPERHADGVSSLGVRPVFGGGRRVLEVHLFDVDEDLYGIRMRCQFVRRQRGEQGFSSVKALVSQMDRDAARARRILHAPGGASA